MCLRKLKHNICVVIGGAVYISPTLFLLIGGSVMDNDSLDSIFDDQESNVQGEAQEGVSTSQQEIAPVRLGRLATTGIVATGIIILMILIVTLKSCSIEKKNSSGDGSKITENYKISDENRNEVESRPVESNHEEVISNSSTADLNSTNEISSVISDNSNSVVESSVGAMSESDSVVLSEVSESRGMVISKHCYAYEGSYIYDIEISVLIGDEAKTAHYFCPKKSYDALNSTDSVNVMYQFDSIGMLSIYSISKGN